jgi:hypothetical protein
VSKNRIPGSKPAQEKSAMQKLADRLPFELTTERVIVGGSILGTILILVIISLVSIQKNYAENRTIDGVQSFPGVVASHVTTVVNYPQTPPVGGAHNPVWQTCGVYTEPISNEHAVHSLEHGVVWITYQPDLPFDQVQTLQDLTRRGSHRLLSPYPGIDSPIILTAWGYQLRVNDANDPRIGQFISKYEEGPTTPELGASCAGGETRVLSQLPNGF